MPWRLSVVRRRWRPSPDASPARVRASRSCCLPGAASGGFSRSRCSRSPRSTPDSTWKNTIHLGTEYAALLVDAGLPSAATTDVLPQPGGAVIAVATVKGTGDFVRRPREGPDVQRLRVGGARDSQRSRRAQRLRSGQRLDRRGGIPAPELAQRDGRWTSAEVILTRSLGYGTYIFVVRDTSHLDPAAALGLLTWDDQGADQNHRELDIEISQWGDRSIPNAQYVVQPYYVPANVVRFAAPRGHAHAFVPLGARPGVVQDRSRNGASAAGAAGRPARVHVRRADPGHRARAHEPVLLPVLRRRPRRAMSRSSLRGSSTSRSRRAPAPAGRAAALA